MNKAFHETHLNRINSERPYIYHHYNKWCPPHWHENVEILYFRGDCRMACEREDLEITVGDIAVVNSNALHGLA